MVEEMGAAGGSCPIHSNGWSGLRRVALAVRATRVSGFMNADRSRHTAEPLLSKRLARGYLTVVAFVWGGHVAVVLLFLVTGRSSWRTEIPWIVLPTILFLASAFGTIWWVERLLHRNRRAITHPFRIVGLAYGSAVPTAWRRLRG